MRCGSRVSVYRGWGEGRVIPPGSGRVGLELGRGEGISVPEEWLRLSRLPVPSAPASRHFCSVGGGIPWHGPTFSLCPLPPFKILCQIKSNSS